jgi:hypothetical protein
MTIKLLGNGHGIIITRTPEIIGDVLELVFDGAADDMIAVVSSSNKVFYRALDEGRCLIKAEHLSDEASFSVVSEDKRLRYQCEKTKFKKLPDGKLLVYPNDVDFAEDYVRVKIELDDLYRKYGSLLIKIDNLEKTFENMMEGYGLV